MKPTRAFTFVELLFAVSVVAILAMISVPNFLEAQIRTKTARVAIDMASLHAGIRAYYADYDVYPPNHPEVQRYLRAVAPHESATADGSLLATPDDAQVSWAWEEPKRAYRPMNRLVGIEVRDPPPAGEVDVEVEEPVDPDSEHAAWLRMVHYIYNSHQTFSPAYAASGASLSVITTPVAYFDTNLKTDPFADTRILLYRYINTADVADDALNPDAARSMRFYLHSYGPDADQSGGGGPGFVTSTMANPINGPFQSYDPTNGTVSRGDLFVTGADAAVPR